MNDLSLHAFGQDFFLTSDSCSLHEGRGSDRSLFTQATLPSLDLIDGGVAVEVVPVDVLDWRESSLPQFGEQVALGGGIIASRHQDKVRSSPRSHLVPATESKQ